MCDMSDNKQPPKQAGFQKEYFLDRASPKSIWNQISTSRGLSEWFAPKVDINAQGKIHIFWDDKGDDRIATITERTKDKVIQWNWDDEPQCYIRMEIVSTELSKSTSLIVTDYDLALEQETLENIWAAHEERLFYTLGVS